MGKAMPEFYGAQWGLPYLGVLWVTVLSSIAMRHVYIHVFQSKVL
jgi:hypothetical protein